MLNWEFSEVKALKSGFNSCMTLSNLLLWASASYLMNEAVNSPHLIGLLGG
jgi:hypothetical protein